MTRQADMDPRMVVVWLGGSFGRGEDDEWSDLDVYVVVTDESFEAVARGRNRVVEGLGEAVLRVEAPQNGPRGGVYLMVGYDCAHGLQLVDWYWQPLVAASRPSATRLLVEKAPLPANPEVWPPRSDLWNPTLEERASNAEALAWAMIAIQAKRIARKPNEDGLEFDEFIRALIADATGASLGPPNEDELGDPGGRLDRLIWLSDVLLRLRPESRRVHDSVKRMLRRCVGAGETARW